MPTVEPMKELPEIITISFVKQFINVLETCALSEGELSIREFVPDAFVTDLLERCTSIVAGEPVVVDVKPPAGVSVNVHGDLHGHFFDLLHCLSGAEFRVLDGGKYCVFNGAAQRFTRRA